MPRDLRSGTFEIFLVPLLYDICSTVDVFKISSCLYIMLVSWFLCVFYSMTFVLRNTDPTQREGICSFADIKKKQLKFMLNFALFC